MENLPKDLLESKKINLNKVTPQNLDLALRMCNIQISIELLDKVIDVVEILANTGNKTTLSDMSKLQSEWNYASRT